MKRKHICILLLFALALAGLIHTGSHPQKAPAVERKGIICADVESAVTPAILASQAEPEPELSARILPDPEPVEAEPAPDPEPAPAEESTFPAEESTFPAEDSTFPDPEPEYIPEPEEEQQAAGPVYLGTFTVTAYCNCPECCGAYSGGPTASGAYPSEGWTCACNAFPLGTVIYIDGIGPRCIEDRGDSIMDETWIDLYFEDHDEAQAFGMRYLDVYLE